MRIIIAILVTVFIGSHTPVHINNSTPEQHHEEVVVIEPSVDQVEVANQTPTETVATVVETVQETPVIRPEKAELLRAVNIPEDQWYAVDYILSKESTDWCPTRWQDYHGTCPDAYYLEYEGAETDPVKGYGICQATPAIKMESAGSDWRTNALTQLRWCNDYAITRYGSWHGAYNAWLRQNWW